MEHMEQPSREMEQGLSLGVEQLFTNSKNQGIFLKRETTRDSPIELNGIGVWNKESNKFTSFELMFPGDGRTEKEKAFDPSNFNFLMQSGDLIIQVKFSKLKWKKAAREEIFGPLPLPDDFVAVVEEFRGDVEIKSYNVKKKQNVGSFKEEDMQLAVLLLSIRDKPSCVEDEDEEDSDGKDSLNNGKDSLSSDSGDKSEFFDKAKVADLPRKALELGFLTMSSKMRNATSRASKMKRRAEYYKKKASPKLLIDRSKFVNKNCSIRNNI